MPDRDQQFTDAAARYMALVAAGTPAPAGVLAAIDDAALREELAVHLEFVLATGQPAPVEAANLSPAEQAAVARAGSRVEARLRERLRSLATHATSPAAPRSLSALRISCRLSVGQLARRLNLPVDLMARIERGGVIAASLPSRLIAALAEALQAAEAEVYAALAAPPAPAALRLSASDGTTTSPETPIPFAEALAASTATPQQRRAWEV